MRWLLILLFLSPAWASPPIMLDTDMIEVTTNFRGTNIELTSFLETNAPETRFVVVGPPATLTFRNKERRAGLWINVGKEVLSGVASYVALVGFDEGDIAAGCQTGDLFDYTHAGTAKIDWICDDLHRTLMADKGLFVLVPEGGVEDLGQGFFRANAFLPPTARPGTYWLRFWAGQDSAQAQLKLRRAGLERWILMTAQNHRLLYGLLCLFLAGLAGYVTNLIFSRRA